MSNFIITPSNPDLLNLLVRDPITGLWTIPIMTFNIKTINPYYGEIDPLNEDPKYQNNVVKHFYMRLIEKWLYKDFLFRNLLKYFKTERNGDEVKVTLIPNLDNLSSTDVDKATRKFIFRYIEKVFITKKFVDKALRQYVNTDPKRIKWYDFFNNTGTLKELLSRKLEKLIIKTIYELQDKEAKRKKNSASRIKKSYNHNNRYDEIINFNNNEDIDDENSIWDD